jgi:outer membrane protein assembly factor BamE (lipoprotein component of BamABCDE complex)
MIKLHNKPILAAALLALALSGCSTFRQPIAGTPLADVTNRLGKPTAVYPDPDGSQWLEYRGQPMGQFQHMAHVGADGRLISYEQVLTSENFARVKVNDWTREQVARNFGQPAEKSQDRATGYAVWSYRYKQDNVWNSFLNIYFNARGVVLKVENTADPLLDDRFKGM